MFRHPKYYKELRKRNKSDQAISSPDTREVVDSVRSDPGLKLQAQCDSQEALQSQSRASSFRRQASSFRTNLFKHQEASVKPQAASFKLQAAGRKLCYS